MEECEHEESYEGYMIRQGIERKTCRCKKCHILLDYYPQYIEDNFED